MKTAIQKTMWLCMVALTMTACKKDGDSDNSGTTDECSYKVTIDGVTTQPNQFGEDKIVFTTSADTEDPEDRGFALSIDQAKTNSTEKSVLMLMGRALLNSKLATGDYPAIAFSTTAFSNPQFAQWPYYVFSEEDNDTGVLALTILENSDKRIRVKASGEIAKAEDGYTQVSIVPVEVEITIGRKHYTEVPVEGELFGGAYCDCQK